MQIDNDVILCAVEQRVLLGLGGPILHFLILFLSFFHISFFLYHYYITCIHRYVQLAFYIYIISFYMTDQRVEESLGRDRIVLGDN
ncbi:hypothetical protein EYC80_001195 [Monilinia laxa]|uniref:Uncharacterized protein n=1 Tax=Monilinia laxa TaxID=61186 RepID=A0A5N6K9D7_MONLA|nr:hypothetical protein EYC80_001195 [Monilinia laxa]